ncbi:MAG: hypothetical protein KTR16_15265 [Acidiferrobacterales bacterium]|nr:hypothetical protein [Acidiferrobacterales bacterium]
MEIVTFLFKWFHLLFGITWIGMLYYFNFVQAEYFKDASPEGLKDAKAKLAPKALFWFRWAAMATFITGVILLTGLKHSGFYNDYIVIGSVLGFFMFMNVWHVIWPAQKIVLGLKEGDVSIAAPKAARASRTNVLFSAPMAFCMLASPHLGYSVDHVLSGGGLGPGLWVSLLIVLALQLNGLFGKMGPMASIRGIIHLSLALSVVIYCALLFM